MTEIIVLILFPGLMVFAASMDIFTMTISNRISLALVIGFFPAALMIGLPWPDIGMHVLAGMAMLLVGFAMFCCRFIGGGDAKLFAATALWFGWGDLLTYAIFLSVLGGVWTVVILIARSYPLPLFLMTQGWATRLHEPRGDIPYGVALAAGGLLVYPYTVWFQGVA